MARTPDLEMKRELLDRVVAHLAEHGLAGMSLRPMAAALETSPNRLVHHFGSKEELLAAALMRAVEIQEEVRDEWHRKQPGMTQADQLRKWWKWLNESPANLALTRLGLEAATLEATQTGLSGELRAEQISVWRQHIEQRLLLEGVPRQAVVVEATVLKAFFTGLILDLMATGDRARLGRALELGLRRSDLALAASRDERAPRGKADARVH
jgi:AcrR family transcriptional regulator